LNAAAQRNALRSAASLDGTFVSSRFFSNRLCAWRTGFGASQAIDRLSAEQAHQAAVDRIGCVFAQIQTTGFLASAKACGSSKLDPYERTPTGRR
jgi:hypothetical protein